jgi:hypothetical protein
VSDSGYYSYCRDSYDNSKYYLDYREVLSNEWSSRINHGHYFSDLWFNWAYTKNSGHQRKDRVTSLLLFFPTCVGKFI